MEVLITNIEFIKTNINFKNNLFLVRDNLRYNNFLLIVVIQNLNQVLLWYEISISIITTKIDNQIYFDIGARFFMSFF